MHFTQMTADTFMSYKVLPDILALQRDLVRLVAIFISETETWKC